MDVLYSFREVRKEIETASVRAAKFRTTAIENAILGVLMADLSLVKLSREKGFDTLSPFLGTHIECAYDGEKNLGEVDLKLLKEASESAGEKDLFFYLPPGSWLGVAVVRWDGKTYLFCHRVPYLKSILSKRLGAIAKYGAEFYFGSKADVGKVGVMVSYGGSFTNTRMFVVVPYENILKTLVKERVFVYLRMYVIFLLFLITSYLLWARLINYPVMRLRHVVGELERGNYDVDFGDILRARDEFGAIAKLMHSYLGDIKKRFEKLELIMETSMSFVSSPEDIPRFIKDSLGSLEEIFGVRASLFLVEEKKTGKTTTLISSRRTSPEQAESLLRFYESKKDELRTEPEEPVCYREEGKRGCKSLLMFRLDDDTNGCFAFRFKGSIDRVDESYLKVVCQHIVGTIKLSYLASTDPLTGIPNRRVLENDLRNYGRLAKRYQKPLSLIMLDIDNFKSINDTYGHGVGDKVLKKVARLIKESIRETDTVYRYGGEEFAILCPETDKHGAYELSERIRERVKSTGLHVGEGKRIFITVSLGVASFPEDIPNPGELLAVADISLYKAKSEGKDKTAILQGSEDKEVFINRFRIKRELASFVRLGSFTYHLQPIYDVQRDFVFGYELLFRLVKDGKEIPIGRFIERIEDVSLIESIDLLSLKKRHPTPEEGRALQVHLLHKRISKEPREGEALRGAFKGAQLLQIEDIPRDHGEGDLSEPP